MTDLVANPREQPFPRVDHDGQLVGPGELLAGAEPLPPHLNPYIAYRESFSNPESRRSLIGCLDRISGFLAEHAGQDPVPGETFLWHRLRFAHTTAIRSLVLAQEFSPAYARKHMSALRQVLKYSWRLELISAEDYQRAIELEPISGTRLPAGRSIAEAEIAGLLQACASDPGPAGVRDAALIAMLYTTGARRFEIASAQREDYDIGDRSLRVLGKGDKERRVYVSEQAAELVGRWLALSEKQTGPLLLRIDKWGTIKNQGISGDAIGERVKKRRIQATVPRLTAHDFRRTFIGDLLDRGADLPTAQALAGHASPATTSRYDRRPDKTRKAAVDRLSVPTPETGRPPEDSGRPVVPGD